MSIIGSDGTPDKWGAQELGTPSGTLTWYADLSGLPTSSGTDAQYMAELTSAFALWADVADVTFLEVDAPGAGVDITFDVAKLETIAPTLPNIEDAAGLASRTLINGSEIDRITDVDIYFDTDLTWRLDGNFFKVAAHEIGHGLGLEHIDSVDEIMNATVFVDRLGTQDISSVRTLYGEASGDDPPDGPDDPPPDDDDTVVSAGGGGGGGGIALLGILAAIMAFFFGGAGGGAAVAALGDLPDDDDIEGDDDLADLDLNDLTPVIETDLDLVFIEGHGNFSGHAHGYGCGCSHCAMTPEEPEDFIV